MTRPIGVQIRDLREARGMSICDVFERCYLTMLTIEKVESGEIEPDMDILESIAYALNARLEIQLVAEEER